MNKATLNQIATYSPINTYLSFSRGESRGRDTYGYPIYRLTDTNTGQVYKTTGCGFDTYGTNLSHFIIDLVSENPLALKALAKFVYSEVKNKEGIPYGLTVRNLDKCKNPDGQLIANKVAKEIENKNFYLDGACGESCMKRISKGMGIIIKDEYQRAKTRKGTDKFLGARVTLDPEGILVKMLAREKTTG